MSDTPTRPPAIEQDRLRNVADMILHIRDDIEWRTKQAEMLGTIIANQQWAQEWRTRHDRQEEEWRLKHEKRDDERFLAIGKRISRVTSSVTGFEALRNRGIGMWQILAGGAIFIAGLGAFLGALMVILKAFGAKSP